MEPSLNTTLAGKNSKSQRRILFLGTVWPEPQSSAAGRRMLALVGACLEDGMEVCFASASKDTPDRKRLEDRGVSTHGVALNDSSFDAWIAELKPDAVVFDRFILEEQFAGRIQSVLPETLRIIDTEDLHFLRRGRERALQGTSPKGEDRLRELAALYRSDLSVMISSYEMKLLTRDLNIPEELLLEIPFGYPASPTRSLPFGERLGFVMIGNFRHAPNVDGVRWFRKEIWPQIRTLLPQARVDLFGAYPSKEMMALTDEAIDFRVRGHAEPPVGEAAIRGEAPPVLEKYRVNLAPLRFGAGLKGKIADGWWSGTPVVTTSVGAEGMAGEGHSFGGSIADSPEAFARAAVELHETEKTWAAAQTAGFTIMKERFDAQTHARTWTQSLNRLMGETPSERSDRRARNLIGQILWHQTLRSTEYFSRWIELKNAGTLEGTPKPNHA